VAVTTGIGVCVIMLVGGFIPFTIADIPGDEVGGCIFGGVSLVAVLPFFFSIR
jgi:hypothetical protein